MATRHHHWQVRVGAPCMVRPASFQHSTVQYVGRLHGYAQCVLCEICCRRVATTPCCPPRPITVIHPTDHTTTLTILTSRN